MDEIKSAREIAMEKIAKLEAATDNERLKWKYAPAGEKLAARYLRENCNLAAELDKYDKKAREYVSAGAAEVLIRAIDLPRSDAARNSNRKAMEGLKALKKDKVAVENVYSNIRRIFAHYAEQGEQQRRQAYEALKGQMAAKIQQAFQQQTGLPSGIRIDVEKQPQFQEEWRKMQGQMDSAYLTHLAEYKHELANIV
ncbi:MAG: hypothetical protein ABH839_00630 [Chloroflexota bacterium]